MAEIEESPLRISVAESIVSIAIDIAKEKEVAVLTALVADTTGLVLTQDQIGDVLPTDKWISGQIMKTVLFSRLSTRQLVERINRENHDYEDFRNHIGSLDWGGVVILHPETTHLIGGLVVYSHDQIRDDAIANETLERSKACLNPSTIRELMNAFLDTLPSRNF